MIKNTGIFFLTALLILFSVCGGFAMSGKVQNIPMKTYTDLNIPDGEFLHYGGYRNEEKTGDSYQVIKIITNEKGNINYKIYQYIIFGDKNRKPPVSYMDWPSYYSIDPKSGSVIESKTVYLDTNNTTNEINVSMGFEGLLYWSYKYNAEKGFVEENTKTVHDTVTNTRNYKVYVNQDYPIWDATSLIYYLGRFIDPDSPGIFYLVVPEIMKNPIPLSLRNVSTGTLETKAGIFRIKKEKVLSGDPFIGKLMEPFLKNWEIWVEDSSRRLIIKLHTPSDDYIMLEQISNVKHE